MSQSWNATVMPPSGFNTKATYGFCRHHGDFSQLLRRRVIVDVGVGDKGVTAWQQQSVHRSGRMHAFAVTKHLFNYAEVLMIVANRPQIIASASPRCTMIAPITVVLAITARCACSWVIPNGAS